MYTKVLQRNPVLIFLCAFFVFFCILCVHFVFAFFVLFFAFFRVFHNEFMLVYHLFLQEQIKDIIIIEHFLHFLCAFLAFCVCFFLHFFAQQLQCKKRKKNACCAKKKCKKCSKKCFLSHCTVPTSRWPRTLQPGSRSFQALPPRDDDDLY